MRAGSISLTASIFHSVSGRKKPADSLFREALIRYTYRKIRNLEIRNLEIRNLEIMNLEIMN